MSQFRTIVDIPVFKTKLDHRNEILLIGSCFSENIGNKLKESKFNVEINPFGILYNPLSIANSFNILLEKHYFASDDLFYYNDVWNSFYHHSRFSHEDKEVCLININSRIDKASETIKKASFIFITLGTAWVYESIEKKFVVSNCHKLPAEKFNRYSLNETDIIDRFKSLFESLRSINPSLQIVLTVSPIRHWKDGAVNNQVSKSILLLASSKLVDTFDYVHYFPGYEIVMDELRDYRFYGEDMLHPNNVAVEYIWQRFCETFMDEQTLKIMKEYEKISKAMQHRPFNKNTNTYHDFKINMIKKIKAIKSKYPYLDLKDEMNYFS